MARTEVEGRSIDIVFERQDTGCQVEVTAMAARK